jgi:predicted Zn-dependent protease
MFDAIVAALEERSDLLGWTARHVTSCGAQLYSVPDGVESVRGTQDERYILEVLRDTTVVGAEATVGAGNVTVLPGDDIHVAIEAAVLRAGLVHNRPYSLPGPALLPDVPLADPGLSAGLEGALNAAYGHLRDAVAAQAGVRLVAAELFADHVTTRLCNSRGIDATQTGTSVAAEWVLLAQKDDREVETFVEMTRRRMQDLPLADEMARQARWTRDLLDATHPPSQQGPVVLRDAALSEFVSAGVIQTLGSASQKFAGASTWEIGKSVLPSEGTGDPLSVWANRQVPYGVGANRFDAEGIPSQRLALIQDNVLQAFSAGQRYAEYLAIPATGDFGVIEVAPGSRPAAGLVSEPHIEVAAFSWFNPDEITGDFASEIRLGYVVGDGKRTPFKGGQLIGNYLQALAGARWSRETGFYGSYLGPTTVRFETLTVAA